MICSSVYRLRIPTAFPYPPVRESQPNFGSDSGGNLKIHDDSNLHPETSVHYINSAVNSKLGAASCSTRSCCDSTGYRSAPVVVPFPKGLVASHDGSLLYVALIFTGSMRCNPPTGSGLRLDPRVPGKEVGILLLLAWFGTWVFRQVRIDSCLDSAGRYDYEAGICHHAEAETP
jgi:hypothetical protein